MFEGTVLDFSKFSNEKKAIIAQAIRENRSGLSAEQMEQLRYEWRFWARPNQVAPDGDWDILLFLAGRGAGKTRSMVEWLRERVRDGARNIVIAGATAPSIRNVIVEGPSGILANSPAHERPKHYPSMSRLVWPNGAKAELLSAEEPDRFRGPQCDTAICDELASWYGSEIEDLNSDQLAWNQLRLGCRLGSAYGMVPKIFIATTPKPTPLIRALKDDPMVKVLTGSTFDNSANLAPSYLRAMIKQFDGTRLGRQELYAEILDEAKGALWKGKELEKFRIKTPEDIARIRKSIVRMVVAIDPAVSSKKTSDETGIIVAGLGPDGHCYIFEDHSGRYTPDKWGRKAINAYDLNRADRIIAEKNNGGDLVEQNLRTIDPRIPFTAVSASRGKATRAEPVAALSEQGRVHMVGLHQELEKQLVLWDPQSGRASPDRLDAMVWAVTFLMMGKPIYRSMGEIEGV